MVGSIVMNFQKHPVRSDSVSHAGRWT